MYATAIHVVHPTLGEQVNTFLHCHGRDFDWPEEAWRLPEEAPGELVRESTPAPPGGNRVRAYLDVLAPDATGLEAIEVVMTVVWLDLVSADAAADQMTRLPNPVVYTGDTVTIRFGVDPSLLAGRALEFSALMEAVKTILAPAAQAA